MRIEHVALWTTDIERASNFYQLYFLAVSGPRYTNPNKGFESVFLRFSDGARLEIMRTSTLNPVQLDPESATHGTHPSGDCRGIDIRRR